MARGLKLDAGEHADCLPPTPKDFMSPLCSYHWVKACHYSRRRFHGGPSGLVTQSRLDRS